MWIIGTLLLTVICALIAKRSGYEYLVAIYAAMVVTANILASKIVVFFRWTVPAAVIVYSSTFLVTDILAEFYGKEKAKKAVWAGFLANIILLLSVWIAIRWPGAQFWTHQEAFVTVLGSTWRVIAASITAYLVSQNHDVWAYCFWKRKTKGKYLWLRNNASTIISQFIDTVIFITVAFFGKFPIGTMIIGQYIAKITIAIIDTPFLYLTKIIYSKYE